MKKDIKLLIPLAIDYSLAMLAATRNFAKNNRISSKQLLPFIVEIGFHTFFHLGSKGVLTFILTRKGRTAGIKAIQWAFIISKPFAQKKILNPILAHPHFHKASTKFEQIVKKVFPYFRSD